MLIAYSTLPGYVSNRDHFRGTWFIESICKAFMAHAKDMDLRDLLDEAAWIIKEYESESGTKQSFGYEVNWILELQLSPSAGLGEALLQEALLQPRPLRVQQREVETHEQHGEGFNFKQYFAKLLSIRQLHFLSIVKKKLKSSINQISTRFFWRKA